MLLGAPDHEALTINDCVGAIGHMTNVQRSGGDRPQRGAGRRQTYETELAELRRRSVEDVPDEEQTRGRCGDRRRVRCAGSNRPEQPRSRPKLRLTASTRMGSNAVRRLSGLVAGQLPQPSRGPRSSPRASA